MDKYESLADRKRREQAEELEAKVIEKPIAKKVPVKHKKQKK